MGQGSQGTTLAKMNNLFVPRDFVIGQVTLIKWWLWRLSPGGLFNEEIRSDYLIAFVSFSRAIVMIRKDIFLQWQNMDKSTEEWKEIKEYY